MKTKNKLSRFISLILRHKPEVIGISLDKNGWANVNELIDGINYSGRHIDFELLEEIVRTDNKGRYSFNEDKTLIRANQGHTLDVDLELKPQVPPIKLWHGTAKRFLGSIYSQGLLPMGRQYVHLSRDIETAKAVGKRHGDVAVFEIDTEKMQKDGYDFYLSENKVWLTKEVPAKYLTQIL